MAYTGKNYLDLTGLQSYDGLIKAWVDGTGAGAKSAVVFRTVLYDSDNIYFYHKNGAVLGTDRADVTVPLSGSAVSEALAKISAIVSALGGTMASASPYTISFSALTTDAKSTLVAAINEIDSHTDTNTTAIGTLGSLTTTEKSNLVGALNEVRAKLIADIAALDANVDVSADAANGDFYVLTGVDEADGVISKGDEKLLKKVASTGAAEDLSNTVITDGAATDPQTLYAAGDVQTTLTSIARDLNALESESAVTVEKLATAETGYIASYAVKQNGAQVGATINIPKDYLVKSASVQTVTVADQPYTGAKVGDKYIDFVINVKEGTATDSHIYIPVNDLVHPLSGGTTTVANMYELQVSVSATNQITATLNNIYGAKVSYTPTSATTKLTGVTEVAGALDTIDTLIQGMDADLNAAAPASGADANAIGVVSGVTEVDGIITSVDTAYADAAGSATAAYNAISSIPDASITALFSTT